MLFGHFGNSGISTVAVNGSGQKDPIRIEWADIFKGFAILCVIYGHIGCVGNYVYQFHMAAFFFISGYLTNLTRDSFGMTLLKKSYSLLLPLIVMVFAFIGVGELLRISGWDSFLFLSQLPPAQSQIELFLTRGGVAIELLGATWFIGTLFLICVLEKFVADVILGGREKEGQPLFYPLFALISVGLYFCGVLWFERQDFPNYNFDLALAGQLYFCLGVLDKKFRFLEKLLSSHLREIAVLLVSAAVIFWLRTTPYPAILFPTRRIIGGVWLSFFAACNGILFCYCLSRLIAVLPWKKIRSGFSRAGQDSLGILFFHFLMFKAGYAILALFGVVSWSYLRNFVPVGNEIIYGYHPVLFVASLIGSVLLWEGLGRVPGVAFLLGMKKQAFLNACEAVANRLRRCVQKPRLGELLNRYRQVLEKPLLLAVTGWFLWTVCRWIISPDNHFLFDDYTSWYRCTFRENAFDTFSLLPGDSHDDRPVRDVFMYFVFRPLQASEFLGHMLLLCIQLLNCGLLYVCVRRFYRAIHRQDWFPALLTVLIWAAWPTTMLASYWLSGIHDSLGLTFCLLLFLLYFSSPNGKSGQVLRLTGSVILYFILLRTKEMFIVMPCALLLLSMLRFALSMPDFRMSRIFAFRPDWTIGVLWFGMFGYIGMIFRCGDPGGSYAISFSPATVLSNLIKYVTLYFDFWTATMNSIPTPAFVYVLACVVLYLFWAGRKFLMDRNPAPAVLFLLFCCMISTVLVLKQQTHILYLYVPSVFGAVIMALAVDRISQTVGKTIACLGTIGLLILAQGCSGPSTFRAFWTATGRQEQVAMKRLKSLGRVPENTRFYILGLENQCNIFTYGPRLDQSMILGIVFREKNLYREFSPEQIDTSLPYYICSNYPELSFLTMEEYERTQSATPSIKTTYPSEAKAGSGFNVQPDGSSALFLEGRDIPENCELLLNGKAASGVCRVNDRGLTSLIPKELLQRPGRIELRLRIREKSIRYQKSETHPAVWSKRQIDRIVESEPFFFTVK